MPRLRPPLARLGDYLQAETYAAYSQGLTYYSQGDYAAAEPYFEQTRGFMYGNQRYSFCHAYVLETSEAFAEAAEWYLALGNFEDAPNRAAYCQARVAVEAGDYEAALVKYAEASGYRDAEERLDKLNFEIYERATALLDAREYEQAFLLFTLLGDRYNAAEYARTAKKLLAGAGVYPRRAADQGRRPARRVRYFPRHGGLPRRGNPGRRACGAAGDRHQCGIDQVAEKAQSALLAA